MAETKSLCAIIPLELHQRVCREKEELGMTANEYITKLITEYYEMKNGGSNMACNTKTMAFQIPESLFQRIKAHLERETARTGKKLTQREFVLGLIEQALDEAERETENATLEPEEENAGEDVMGEEIEQATTEDAEEEAEIDDVA